MLEAAHCEETEVSQNRATSGIHSKKRRPEATSPNLTMDDQKRMESPSKDVMDMIYAILDTQKTNEQRLNRIEDELRVLGQQIDGIANKIEIIEEKQRPLSSMPP
ncbi:unnamed protein product [Cylicocyclus nassatus]|uniref:Uncharacterized protein n=1 Tax=Cylicocyclus nassatus TaxID=53992 RepID=A0AA36MDY2_CYLNA|nr:unnamed protein product [Cylicocyclus nassatus]